MLLKVSDGVGGWVYFDAVDKAHLASVSYTVKTPTELNQLVGESNHLNLIAKECFLKGESIVVGVVEFETRGMTRRAFFTNVVYVCNDRGDTLDRLNVERRVEKRRQAS